MAKSIVRDSKFRHVFSEVAKAKYEDLRPTTKATESSGLKANEKLIAMGWESGGGGSLAVIPTSKTGRLGSDVPLITGHKGPILDFEWNPFDDNMLLSSSEDLTVKLWNIPDAGLAGHLKEPLATLEGHGKKVSFCHWNRCASHIFASTAFDLTTRIWNVAEQEECYKIEMPDQVWSMKWNYDGSLLATTAKDKKLRIIDPRASKFVAEREKVHDGSKASKVEWLGSPDTPERNNRLLTTGFSAQAERQIGVWDMRNLEEPLNLMVLDQGTGPLFPYYDAGTGMSFFPAKGDATIRYFEMEDKDPHIHFISNFAEKTPFKAFDFLPKRACDTTKHSIMKAMVLQEQGRAAHILQVDFKVPRKSEAYQEDLYPDAPSQEPAQTADQWTSGAACTGPKLQSMEPGKDGAPRKKSEPAVAIVSMKDLKAELAEAKERIKALEAENAELKAKLG